MELQCPSKCHTKQPLFIVAFHIHLGWIALSVSVRSLTHPVAIPSTIISTSLPDQR
jgi:hypothetical protein